MRRTLVMLMIAVLLALSTACAEIELGDVPLYCNLGEPRCPGGYTCELQGGEEVCVRKDGERQESPAEDGGHPSGADGAAGP
jgi:hypothetical protein